MGVRLTREQIARIALESDKDNVQDVLIGCYPPRAYLADWSSYYSNTVSLDLRDEDDNSVGAHLVVEQDGELS